MPKDNVRGYIIVVIPPIKPSISRITARVHAHPAPFHKPQPTNKDKKPPKNRTTEALGLTIKAVLKERKRKPDEIALALIDAKTKTFMKITLEEVKKAWNVAFK